MAAFLFTCPVTQFRVQDWSDDDDSAEDRYEGIDCPACARVHFVNPKTGEVLGEGNE
jgi:hypothetical protein